MIDRVKFQDPISKFDLVVEGGVNTFTQEQFIKLSLPSYKISDSVIKILDAQVFIDDIPLKINTATGIYSGFLTDNKKYNQAYHLKILYKEKIYEADDTLKRALPITINDLNITSQRQDANLTLAVPKHLFGALNPGKLFYLLPNQKDWEVSKLGENQSYSYIHTNAPPYGLFPVLENRSNFNVHPADSIKIYKFSASADYEKYLYNLFQETDWKSVFSTNPGAVKGNISGKALGYFYCTDVITKKIAAIDLEK